MNSIQSSISELDRSHELQAALLATYLHAIKSTAQYAVELDAQITGPHRQHLTELADQVASGRTDVVTGSGATFRGLVRDYRDKAARYLEQLRDELAGTARALQETLDSLAQSAGDHETQLRKSVVVLREVSEEADVNSLRAKVHSAADSIEVSLEQVRKEHQLTVAQFLMEIRVLHQRIDSLEAAASLDSMTGLYERGEMEDRIRSARPGSFHLLLFQVQGINRAEAQFGRSISDELAASFTKRLKNTLPETATLGRWSPEEFIALIAQPRDPKSPAGRSATDQLSGTYSCLQSGKTVRPSLHVSVGIVDSVSRETAERTLDRVKMFLTGAG
jgi:GGDEF domain-containing protein